MQSLQKHAPEMKEIQKKYKGDRQKLNEEMMKFYRENNINPAASCLPLARAAPGLLRALLRPARTSRSTRRRAPTSSWLAHRPEHRRPRRTRTGRATCCSRSTPAARCSRRGSCRRRWTRRSGYIMMVLPLVFIRSSRTSRSGLVLYWVTTNLWTVGQGLSRGGSCRRRRSARRRSAPKRSSQKPPPRTARGNGARKRAAEAEAGADRRSRQPTAAARA